MSRHIHLHIHPHRNINTISTRDGGATRHIAKSQASPTTTITKTNSTQISTRASSTLPQHLPGQNLPKSFLPLPFRTLDEFDPAEHPQAPKGASGGKGGQFVAKGSGGGGGATTQPRRHLPGKAKPQTKSTRTKETFVPMPEDRSQLPEHIRKLRIPPAWTNVHYNPDPNGRRLVYGNDEKGRRQPLMSSKNSQKQAEQKYNKIKKMLPKFESLKKQNSKYLNSNDPAIRQHAECLQLIMETGLRPGSDRDTGAEEQAYGATTLQGQNIVKEGNKVYLRFVGKKGVRQDHEVLNKDVAEALVDRAKKVGPTGKIYPEINDSSLRRYSQRVTGYNPKDFRTRLGTQTANDIVQSMIRPTTKREIKQATREVCEKVAAILGNEWQQSFKSYISPYVWDTWKQAA